MTTALVINPPTALPVPLSVDTFNSDTSVAIREGSGETVGTEGSTRITPADQNSHRSFTATISYLCVPVCVTPSPASQNDTWLAD
jgi:hypothetical protein